MFFIDLNIPKGHTSAKLQKEMTCEFRKNNFCPTHGLSTHLRIPSMCPTIPWSLQDEKLFMLGSVSLHGLRTAYVSRKSKGHRGLSSLSSTEALPHGDSKQSLTQYSGSCQPGKGLADLCRLCPDSYCPCSTSLYQRFLWRRIESNRLCIGLHHDRSLSLAFPLGQVPSSQRRREIAYSPGSPGKYPLPRYYHPWQDPRRQNPRSTDLRTRSLLYHRPWVSGLQSPLCHSSSLGFLCHPSQKQLSVQTSLLSARGQIHRGPIRPNHCLGRILFSQSLSRQTTAHSLFRCRTKQTPHLFNQQLHALGIDHRRTVSVSLANRTLLHMDQAAPSNQSILWNNRECRQDPNLDSNRRLRTGGHCQKTATLEPEPLHNSTDFECDAFRKNAHFRGSFNHSTPRIREGTL